MLKAEKLGRFWGTHRGLVWPVGSRAGHGHCKMDREALIKPSCRSKNEFSHRFFTDVICP
eukprot:1192679-Prorocentrum_minimum.AAC.1